MPCDFTPTSLVKLLRRRALDRPNDLAYLFLSDDEEFRITYEELDNKARSIASHLRRLVVSGERALLLYPAGLDFITAFFGCLYAGVVAVPLPPPTANRPMPRLEAVLDNAGIEVVLTNTSLLENVKNLCLTYIKKPLYVATDGIEEYSTEEWQPANTNDDTIAMLQYTSGSTNTPRGVVLTHSNLVHNLSVISNAFTDERMKSIVGLFWLPNYHDMGLIGGILAPLYIGCSSVLMSPAAFVLRPYRWLEAITRFRGTISGAPNFAYELCVKKTTREQRATLDLSSWELAFCGAEPIHSETVKRFTDTFIPCGFRPDAFYPCYGLAEATLLVSGGERHMPPFFLKVDKDTLAEGWVVEATPEDTAAKTLVSSGKPLPGQNVVIVHPESATLCAPGEVGEVWLSGPSVTKGYWNRPEETAATFGAYIADTAQGPFLRTGDLGFIHDRELFVTGRLKDLIIIRGRNYYPQDIELQVEHCHPALGKGSTAAFLIEDQVTGEERLVVAKEVDRHTARKVDLNEIIGTIRRTIAEVFDIQVYGVALVREATFPKTSSGKVQRYLCRTEFLDGTLKALAQWRAASLPGPLPSAEAAPEGSTASLRRSPKEIERWLISHIIAELNLSPLEIDVEQPFVHFGMDSLKAISLAADLESWLGRPFSPTLAYDYPNIKVLARHLGGETDSSVAPVPRAEMLGDEGEPIAIIGIGCRFPGASGPAAFWELIKEGVDAVGEAPAGRWDGEDKADVNYGGFLQRVDQFDADFFGISPREAVQMDPQQKLLLEVCWETLEDAGQLLEKLNGTRTGVFVGVSNNEYGRLQFSDPYFSDPFAGTGNALSIIANRLSYWFDLRGPSIAVDTACSSSLVAVHLACRSLWSGECKSALAGGVNLILSPAITNNFREAGFMAPDGRCKTFDARADGYVRGEGIGMILLKPLLKAIAEGDSIYAVIRGSAINQDGRTNGLTAPSGSAQKDVLLQAYRQAGVSPARVQYVEAHGTGTKLGDPIEVQALGEVIGLGRADDDFCAIGSVKTNIGHLEAAAGIAGLIKTGLALKHRTIPPTLHFEKPNSYIPFDKLHLRVQQDVVPWPESSFPSLAGVSSFGFGGTNAHVVLEEAPVSVAEADASEAAVNVLPLSARSPEALEALAKSYVEYLNSPSAAQVGLETLCYNASVRRSHHRYRMARVAQDRRELAARLEEWAKGGGARERRTAALQRSPIVFVFSGQGSQWSEMGRVLQDEPVYQEKLRECDELLRRHADWSLLEELRASPAGTRLAQTQIAQPAICALQLALVSLWRNWGIEPDAVVGHSVGEVAAAQVAGVLSLEQAMHLVYHRGRLMQRASGLGKMAAVELSWKEAQEAVAGYEDRLSVAACNSPHSTVLSGDAQALAEVVQSLERRGIFTRLLDADYAFHSPQMEPYRREMVAALVGLEPRTARLPILSTVTGRVCEPGDFGTAYWGRNIREPVRFSQAIERYVKDGYKSFLEIGPHPVLNRAIRHCLEEQGVEGTVVASLCRQGEVRAAMLAALGTLYEEGHSVKWEGVYPRRRRHVPLPSYPWQRQRYWRENATSHWDRSFALRHEGSSHPLLGQPCTFADAPEGTHYWEARINVSSLPYLSHHVLHGATVLPITVYVESALAAAAEVFGEGRHELRDVRFERILFLPQSGNLIFQVALYREGTREARFKVYSRSTGVKGSQARWTLHVRGCIRHQHPAQVISCGKRQTQKPIAFSPMFFAASEDSLQKNDLYRLVIEAGKFADRNGFSAVWVPERHFTRFGGLYPNPAVLHAALARETERIRLRAGSVVVPLHNPIRIAEEWAMVDNLSRGRVELSFASGWHPNDFALSSPEKYRDRHEELFRGIEVIQRLWHGESLQIRDGKGELAEIRTYPAPVQIDLPVWVTAAGNLGTFARAGEIGANLLTHLLDQDVDKVGEKIAIYRESLEKHGHNSEAGRVALMLHTFIGEDIDVVREQVRKPYCEYLKSIAPLLQGLGASRGTNVDLSSLPEQEQDEFINFLFERFFSKRSLLGTVESCTELVDRLRSVGVDEIACLLDFGPDTDLILENLPHLHTLKEACNPRVRVGGPVTKRGEQLENIRARCQREITGEDYYRRLREQGINDGSTFLAVEHLWAGDGEILGKVRVLDELEMGSYEIHPAFLAACFQVLFAAAPEDMVKERGMLPIPVGLESFTVYKRLQRGWWAWSHAHLDRGIHPVNAFKGDVCVFDSDGDLIAEATGLRLEQKTAPSKLRADTLDGLLYELVWQKSPGIASHDSWAEPGTWILFADAVGIGEQLAGLLEKRGNSCFRVFPGEPYQDSRQYRIPPQSQEAVAKVLSDIKRQAQLPVRGVVHLWSCDATCGPELSGDALDVVQQFGVGSALNVVKAMIAAKKTDCPSRLWLITRGAQPVGGKTAHLAVAQAPLWGFARVVSTEVRELWGGAVDLDPEDAPEIMAVRLFEALSAADREDQIAFRDGERYVARFVRRQHLPTHTGGIRFREDASYLITGGLGDLGLEVARWMVSEGAKHLVLLGRTEIPPRDQWQRVDQKGAVASKIAAIQELENMGASVHLAAVDIGSEEQMASVLEQHRKSGRPEIRGVIHCAAVFGGGILMNLDEQTLMEALRPKVRGGWILHKFFEHAPLDLFVVFSAIPSLLGWMGQGAAHYAAANAFLDALAHYRRTLNLPALSITWGPWGEIGAAARTEGGLDRLAGLGVRAIQPNQGLKLLERLISENPVQAAAVAIDWPQFFKAFSDALDAPLLSELAGELSTHQPTEAPEGEKWHLSRDDLLGTGSANRQPLLQSYFREGLAKILRMPAARLNVQQPLTEIGVDSLMAMEFRTAIQVNLGVTIPLVSFLQGPSLAGLARMVIEQLAEPTERIIEDLSNASKSGSSPPELDSLHHQRDKPHETLGYFSNQEIDTLLESMLDEDHEEVKSWVGIPR